MQGFEPDDESITSMKENTQTPCMHQQRATKTVKCLMKSRLSKSPDVHLLDRVQGLQALLSHPQLLEEHPCRLFQGLWIDAPLPLGIFIKMRKEIVERKAERESGCSGNQGLDKAT